MSNKSVEISASVGEGGVNKEADKVPIKFLLNNFVSAGKLPGCPVLSLSGADRASEPALNRAIRQFQLTYVPVTPDGRVDVKGKTITYLNKPPSRIGLGAKELNRSQLAGAVGKPFGSIRPPNNIEDVKWVQVRLNVKLRFGELKGGSQGMYVPASGRIRPEAADDPTIAVINYAQTRALGYKSGTSLVEPGDKFDLWLQQVHVPDPNKLLDAHLSRDQQLDRRLHAILHSGLLDRADAVDADLKKLLRILLSKNHNDEYLEHAAVKRYLDKDTSTLPTSSLKGYIKRNWLSSWFDVELITTQRKMVSFLRTTLLREMFSGKRALSLHPQGITGAIDPRVDEVTLWYLKRCDMPNSIFYPFEMEVYEPWWE